MFFQKLVKRRMFQFAFRLSNLILNSLDLLLIKRPFKLQ